MESIQPLYERYISPVIAGYERLLNRVDYPAAHDALFPIKETGNKIQEYWDMAMQQKTQAAWLGGSIKNATFNVYIRLTVGGAMQ